MRHQESGIRPEAVPGRGDGDFAWPEPSGPDAAGGQPPGVGLHRGAGLVSRTAAVVRAAEPPADPISEGELSHIWEGQRFPAGALTGPDGRAVEVLYPGRKGGGAGPDFRDAVLRVGGNERIGDVELHVRASYFTQHGHHLDPAYDGLALHVVYLDDAGGLSPLPCGDRVEVAAFAPWVAARSADITGWLARPALWREPCQDASARLGEERVACEVHNEGVRRFLSRREELRGSIAREGPGEALWQALLEALGYGGDREGFRRLARALPAALLAEVAGRGHGLSPAAARNALLCVAGLDAGPEIAAGLPPPLTPPLRSLASRPANRPERRLGAAASLFVLASGDLAGLARRSVRESSRAADLLRTWTAKPAAASQALGAGRATELLMNAVLPFAAALETGLADRCLELAAALPSLPPYGKTAFLERNLARGDGRRPVRGALDQQGLLALHATWCSRGGCGRCPLS